MAGLVCKFEVSGFWFYIEMGIEFCDCGCWVREGCWGGILLGRVDSGFFWGWFKMLLFSIIDFK